MLTISRITLWEILSGDGDAADQETVNAVEALDLKLVVADFELSAHHIGGDYVVGVVDDVLVAQKAGYRIVTWYGPKTEVLVVGVREGDLNLVD